MFAFGADYPYLSADIAETFEDGIRCIMPPLNDLTFTISCESPKSL